MDDALLNLRLREGSRDGLGEAGQVVHAGDENILHAATLQLIQHVQPEFRRFVFAEPHT